MDINASADKISFGKPQEWGSSAVNKKRSTGLKSQVLHLHYKSEIQKPLILIGKENGISW